MNHWFELRLLNILLLDVGKHDKKKVINKLF